MERSISENKRFIKLIELRPCLWDTSSSEYLDKKKKQQCWVEVARALHEDYDQLTPERHTEISKEIRKKWKNLRNSFARELSKRKRMKPGATINWKTYMYFDQMAFLIGAANTFDEDVSDSQIIPSATCEPILKKQKCATNDSSENQIIDFFKKSLQQREQQELKQNDDDDRHFLLSLLSDLKSVPPERKFDVKMEIMHSIKRGLAVEQVGYNPYNHPYPTG